MHSPNYAFFVFIFALQLGIAWLALYLLKKVFPLYSNKDVSRTYWFLTAISFIILVSSKWIAPSDFLSDMLRLSIVWIAGQVTVLLLLPFIYGLVRITGVNKPTLEGEGGLTRRDFLRNSLAALPVAALGITAYGVYSGGSTIVLQKHNLQFPDLPAHLDGFKIVQLSDTHIGSYFNLEKLDEALNAALAENPDLLVITGDLIDDLSLLDETMKRLADIVPLIPYGVYYCWGNHEYFRDISKIRRALTTSPIRLLENTGQTIIEGEQPLHLLGVDYPWAKNANDQIAERSWMMGQALASSPPRAFNILLSHHPDFILNAFESGIPLTLTGHTHGGQVALFGRSLLPVKYRFMRGLYRQGDMYGYVSTGTGHWMPFRLGCPAEISVFTLKA